MAEAAAHAVEAEQRKKDKQKGYRQAAVAKALSKKRKLARGLSDEDYLDVEEEDALDPWDMSRQPSKKKGKAVSAVSANAPTKKRKAVSAVSANAPAPPVSRVLLLWPWPWPSRRRPARSFTWAYR
jgi:hypothetical protein